MNAVIVIDCKDKETVNIVACKAFPETPEGNEQAEALFREWVEDLGDERLAIEDKQTRTEIIKDAISDGLYELGDGYIALMHTT